MQLKDFKVQSKKVESVCDRLNEVRKRIEARKAEIAAYSEKWSDEERICCEKITAIKEELNDLTGKRDAEDVFDSKLGNCLEDLNGKEEKIKDIEELIQNADKFFNACNVESKHLHKDNLAIAQSQLEKYKRNLNEKISGLKKIQDDKDRFRNAAEKVRKFVAIKSELLQATNKTKFERQLSEANKCCLEIEHDRRELFSPIRRAQAMLTESEIEDACEFEKEVREVISLWQTLENEAKQTQSGLAKKYREKQEVIEEVEGLNKMLDDIQKGIKNFRISDLMSLVECEEEIGGLFGGFERKQEKIKRILQKAGEFSWNLANEDEEEIGRMAENAKHSNNKIRCDLQEKQHELDMIGKRFNALMKMADDKERFVRGLCERVKRMKMKKATVKEKKEDYEKTILTMDEVKNEINSICENLKNIQSKLPENENDQCDEMMKMMEKDFIDLEELARSHCKELRDFEVLEEKSLLELQNVNQELIEFEKDRSLQMENFEKAEKELEAKELDFQDIAKRIDKIKNDLPTSETGCFEGSDVLNDMLCDVVSKEDSLGKELKNERSQLMGSIQKKLNVENDLTKALSDLQEIEDMASFTSEEADIREKVQDLLKLKERLDQNEKGVSQNMIDQGLEVLPTGCQKELKERRKVVFDKANLTRRSIESHIAYFEEKIYVKQKTEGDLRECSVKISGMEKRNPKELNVDEIEELTDHIQMVNDERSSLRNVIEVTEDEGFSLMLDDAKERVDAMRNKMHSAMCNTHEKEIDVIDGNTVKEDMIEAKNDAWVERERKLSLNDDKKYLREEARLVLNELQQSERDDDSDKQEMDLKAASNDVTPFVEEEAKIEEMRETIVTELSARDSLSELRDRINTHSQSIQSIDAVNVDLSNVQSLEQCIGSMSRSLDTVNCVLDDIPNLCSSLDEHARKGFDAEVSGLLEEAQSLESTCNATKDRLLVKTFMFTGLKSDSNEYKRKLKELNEKLERAKIQMLEDLEENSNDDAQKISNLSREVISNAKTLLNDDLCSLFVNLPLQEKEALKEAEVALKVRLHEAEEAYVYQKNVQTVQDSLFKLEAVKEVTDACIRRLEEIKERKADVDTNGDIAAILDTVANARTEADMVKGNVQEEVDQCSLPNDLINRLQDTSDAIEISLEKVSMEAEEIKKSKTLALQIEDDMQGLTLIVEKLEQRCDEIFEEEDLMIAIGNISSSIEEIGNVIERVSVVDQVLGDTANDMKLEEFKNLKDKLDLIASKSLKIQQKLSLKSAKLEEVEERKFDLEKAIKEAKNELNELEDKFCDITNIDDVDEVQDLLKFYQFKFKDIGANVARKYESVEECSDGFQSISVAEEVKDDMEYVQMNMEKCLKNLADVQKWIEAIDDATRGVNFDDEEGEHEDSSRCSLTFENLLEDSEDKIKTQVSRLEASIEKFSACEERLNGIERREDYQEMIEPTDISNKAPGRVVKHFIERLKGQIRKCKDRGTEKLALEQDKVTILKLSRTVCGYENSLSDIQSFVERKSNVEDRKEELLMAEAYSQKVEDLINGLLNASSSIEAVKGLNVAATSLSERVEKIRMELTDERKKLIDRYRHFETLEREVEAKKDCVKEIIEEIESAKAQELEIAGEDKEHGGFMNVYYLERRQEWVSSLKTKLKEASAEFASFFEKISDIEKQELNAVTDEANKLIENLEYDVDEEIKEANAIVQVKRKANDLEELGNQAFALQSSLRNEKVAANPIVLTNLERDLDEIDAFIAMEVFEKTGQDVCKKLTEDLKRRKGEVELLIVDVKKTNCDLIESEKRVARLKAELKMIMEKDGGPCLRVGNVLKQIEMSENEVKSRQETIRSTESMMQTLERVSGTIPSKDYDAIKDELLDMNEDCKREIEEKRERIEKLTDLNKCLESLRANASSLFEINPELEVLKSCLPNELEEAVLGITNDERKLVRVKTKIKMELDQLDSEMEWLSEEEKAEIIQIKLRTDERFDCLEKSFDAGKSRNEFKLSLMRKLNGSKSELKVLSLEMESKKCGFENEDFDKELDSMKEKLDDMKKEMHEIDVKMVKSGNSLEEETEMRKEIEGHDKKIDEMLSKWAELKECVETFRLVSEIRLDSDDVLTAKETVNVANGNENMALFQQEESLKNMIRNVEKQENFIADMKEKLKRHENCIDETVYENLMEKLGSKLEVMQEEFSMLSEEMKQKVIMQKEISTSLKKLELINDSLDEIYDVRGMDVGANSIANAVEIVAKNKQLIENAKSDVERIWNQVESCGIKCADGKDLLVSCAKMGKKLDRLKVLNEKKELLLERDKRTIDKIDNVREILTLLENVHNRFDVKSDNCQMELESTEEMTERAGNGLKEISLMLANGEMDDSFMEDIGREFNKLETKLDDLRPQLEIMRESCRNAREKAKSMEMKLKDFTMLIEGLETCSSERSFDEQLNVNSKGAEELRRIAEDFSSLERSFHAIFDLMPENESKRLSEKLRKFSDELKFNEKELEEARCSIEHRLKQFAVNQVVDDVKEKLKAVEERMGSEGIIENGSEKWGARSEVLLQEIGEIEDLESAINSLNEDVENEGNFEINEIKDSLMEMRNIVLGNHENTLKKMNLKYKIENAEKNLKGMEDRLGKAEINLPKIVKIAGEFQKEISCKNEEFVEMKEEFEKLKSSLTDFERINFAEWFDGISIRLDKANKVLSCLQTGNDLFLEIQQAYEKLPKSFDEKDFSQADDVEIFDEAILGLKKQQSEVEDVSHRCNRLLAFVDTASLHDLDLKKSRNMLIKYKEEILTSEKGIGTQMSKIERIREKCFCIANSIECAQATMREIELDDVTSFDSSLIESSLRSSADGILKVTNVAKEVKDVKEAISKAEFELPPLIKERFLETVEELEKGVNEKFEALSMVESSLNEKRSLVEEFEDLKNETQNIESFCNEGIDCLERDNAKSRIESFENVLATIDDLGKRICSMENCKGDSKAELMLKDLEKRKEQLTVAKVEMEGNYIEANSVKKRLDEFEEKLEATLNGFGKGLLITSIIFTVTWIHYFVS